ncbi:hypothetical protein [Aquibacillus saliphilus]|uniref:hypothetical protein n=1 Tax=Aquibacillus saliphilus TaxID=1909422 RepID=UPI001CF01947|nr:hypothetical protein [Aquibacillus saliphilus]
MLGRMVGLLYHTEHGVTTDHYTNTIKLVLGSVLGAIAALFQAAGLFTGIGYLFSMLATGPIVLATILSIRIGFITYLLTTLLLVIIQPTEVVVFLFTTGLLGVGLGVGFKLLKRRLLVAITGAVSLALGMMILLYLLDFPVLGPSVTGEPSISIMLGIFSFCLIYSWIWMHVTLFFIGKIDRNYRIRRCGAWRL